MDVVSPKKEICVWVVPSHDGTVRKLRLSWVRAGILLCCLTICAGLLTFVVGDYARVQLLRGKNYLMLRHAEYQRQKLEEETRRLAGEVESMRAASERITEYHQDVRQRLNHLGSIIDGVRALGALEGDAPLKKNAKDDAGIGGAEVECRFGARCWDLLADGDRSEVAADESTTADDLLKLIDRYTDILRVLPIGLPGNGHVNSGFGYRVSPFHHSVRMHEGTDFALPRGSDVYASGDGVVRRVERNATYGLMVEIEHTPRLITRYAHLSKANVKKGDRVCRGELLGLVGSSGRSTGPHLHYEVRLNDRAVNPRRFLELGAELANG